MPNNADAVIPNSDEGCNTFSDMWAVFAFGYDRSSGNVVSLSFQARFPNKEILEWKKEYPKARSVPEVHALGPYMLVEKPR